MRPTTVQVVARVEVHESPAGDDVTVYPVIAAPPVLEGAVHEMTERAFAFDVADTAVGALGTVEGAAAADAVDATEVPLAFVAVAVNV